LVAIITIGSASVAASADLSAISAPDAMTTSALHPTTSLIASPQRCEPPVQVNELDGKIAPIDVAEFAHPLLECPPKRRGPRIE
jgi:hypothetical protein